MNLFQIRDMVNVDHRRHFFEMVRTIGQSRQYNDAHAIELFLSLFELHRAQPHGVIETQNITEEEKSIIEAHLYHCIIAIAISFFGYCKTTRELLSGMVVFRIEVLPALLSVLDEKSQRDCCALLFLLIRYEHKMLYCINEADYMRNQHGVADGSHALHKHPWWMGNGKMECVEEIVANYRIQDLAPGRPMTRREGRFSRFIGHFRRMFR